MNIPNLCLLLEELSKLKKDFTGEAIAHEAQIALIKILKQIAQINLADSKF